MRKSLLLLAALALAVGVQRAAADSITFQATSPLASVDVSATDPVIIDPTPVNYGDIWSFAMNYAAGTLIGSGRAHNLAGATAVLTLDGYEFDFNAGSQ